MGFKKNLSPNGFEMLPIMTFLNNILTASERISTAVPADNFLFPCDWQKLFQIDFSEKSVCCIGKCFFDLYSTLLVNNKTLYLELPVALQIAIILLLLVSVVHPPGPGSALWEWWYGSTGIVTLLVSSSPGTEEQVQAGFWYLIQEGRCFVWPSFLTAPLFSCTVMFGMVYSDLKSLIYRRNPVIPLMLLLKLCLSVF